MSTQTIQSADTEVKAILIMNPKIQDIDMLQQRFSGQLNVVKLKSGHTAIYAEPWMRDEFEELCTVLMTFQTQTLDLRRSA